MLLHRLCDEWGGVAAVGGDLAHRGGRDVGEVLARHHEERLDLRRHAAVGERHLELVLEVAVDPHAADYDARLLPAAEVDQQAVEHLHLDVPETSLLHVLADHRETVLGRKARALLSARRGNRHHELVVQLRRALDEVEVSERHRIERARIDCFLL